ncbi:MAG: translation initiation factor IF-2 subunit beta [Candidatus Bathyarchaeia archaeon]
MNEKNYEQQLNRLYSNLPKGAATKTRFEPPRPSVVIAGNRTFITNLKHICETLNRDCQHLVRYLAKELATAGSIEEDQAVFQGKFDKVRVNHIVDDYIKEFVICPVCHAPDTKIVREERFRFLVCEACGAKSSVRAI